MPIGPDFHDPPPATPIPELPPYFGMATPPLETVVSFGDVGRDAFKTFQVVVTDPNRADSVFVRWIANYPPYRNGTKIIMAPSQAPILTNDPAALNQFIFVNTTVTCRDVTGAADPTLSVVVSDRDFVTLPTSTDDNQLSYYQDGNAVKQTFVVGTWRIAGCLP